MSVDLRTHYLGLELANPVVPSASTSGPRIDTLKRLQDAGAAAVVLQSLFEEQIEHEELQIAPRARDGNRELRRGAHVPAGAGGLQHRARRRTCVTSRLTKRELAIPVIGSAERHHDRRLGRGTRS